MLKQILAGGFCTALKVSRAAPHSFLSAAHTPSCHRRIVSTRDMARWERDGGPWPCRGSPLSSFLAALLGPSLVQLPSAGTSAFPAALSQSRQEVASLTAGRRGPGMGKWGPGCLCCSRLPHQVLSGSRSSPLQVLLLRAFQEKPWISLAGWLSGSKLGLQSHGASTAVEPLLPSKVWPSMEVVAKLFLLAGTAGAALSARGGGQTTAQGTA